MRLLFKLLVISLFTSGIAMANAPAEDTATSLNSTNTGTTVDKGAEKTTSPQMYDEATTLSETEKKMKKKQSAKSSDPGSARQVTPPLDHVAPEKK